MMAQLVFAGLGQTTTHPDGTCEILDLEDDLEELLDPVYYAILSFTGTTRFELFLCVFAGTPWYI